jgi:hypothetical protein
MLKENLDLDTGERNYLLRFIVVRNLPDKYLPTPIPELIHVVRADVLYSCWTGKRRKHMVMKLFSVLWYFGGKRLNVEYFHVSTSLKLRVTSERATEGDVYAYESSRHDSIYTLQT